MSRKVQRTIPRERDLRRRAAKRLHLRVREARDALGWSRRQVAQRLGVTMKTVQRYETAFTEPSVSVLMRLAGMYRVDLGWLITGKGQKPQAS
jgi:transcriptional regulator with XRE-family HTH domain